MAKHADPDSPGDAAIAEEILGSCIAGRTLQIARIVSARYDAALAQYDLTAHQLTLLSMIALMQPVAARDMLPFLKMEQSTLSRNLDRMAGRGWVRIEPDADDSRTRRVSLSDEGSLTLRSVRLAWQEVQDTLQTDIGEHGFDDLRRLAHTLNPLLPR